VTMSLMPSERLCLKRTRHKLIQTMDVATILPALRAANHFTVDEEQKIMSDPRRRDRVALFLDMVAQKGTETFKAFSNVLADQSPHLYLTMSEWDQEDTFDSGPQGSSSTSLPSSDSSKQGKRRYQTSPAVCNRAVGDRSPVTLYTSLT